MVVIGNMTVGGTIAKVEEFANFLQVCVDAGAKKVLIPAAFVMDLERVPPDLLVNSAAGVLNGYDRCCL